jgi:hypothetical protein
MLRLTQIKHPSSGRRVAIVDEPQLRLLRGTDSIYRLAEAALDAGCPLEKFATEALTSDTLDYASVHGGKSEWRLLPGFDHPDEPARCLVTGTGLTHKASAENRQAMHAAEKTSAITDSMRMYLWGLEGGRPAPGQIGVAPEWFYKGCGTILRAHRQSLEVPSFALDGGEEAEVAGLYLIDGNGTPRRVGLALANEFSDHKLEKQNYLYLAPSKLRTCALGPELIVQADFTDARGMARILRKDQVVWSKGFATGEKNMSHTVGNLEHHHFKYPQHRRPGDVHIHFFGADAFSFGDGIQLQDGDLMEIELSGFGRPLQNPIRIDGRGQELVRVAGL